MFGQSLPYKNIMQKEVYKCFHPPPFGRGLPAQKKVKTSKVNFTLHSNDIGIFVDDIGRD